jgi:hypothetical protein
MKTRMAIGGALLVLALGSADASAQRTTYDSRRPHDFAGVKTFSFKNVPVPTSGTAATTTYDGPLMDERTKAAITRQLESRGLRRDDENPDVVVATRRTFNTEYTFYGPYGWGGYPSWYPYAYGSGLYSGLYGWGGLYDAGWGSSSYEQIRGTLTIDVAEADTGAVVWRGIGSRHVHESSSPSRRDKRVNEEVAEIFKHFPPVGR